MSTAPAPKGEKGLHLKSEKAPNFQCLKKKGMQRRPIRPRGQYEKGSLIVLGHSTITWGLRPEANLSVLFHPIAYGSCFSALLTRQSRNHQTGQFVHLRCPLPRRFKSGGLTPTAGKCCPPMKNIMCAWCGGKGCWANGSLRDATSIYYVYYAFVYECVYMHKTKKYFTCLIYPIWEFQGQAPPQQFSGAKEAKS